MLSCVKPGTLPSSTATTTPGRARASTLAIAVQISRSRRAWHVGAGHRSLTSLRTRRERNCGAAGMDVEQVTASMAIDAVCSLICNRDSVQSASHLHLTS